jgi:hypothetical protein
MHRSFVAHRFVPGKMNLLKGKHEQDLHPHGCVRLNLSELWLGQTSLEFYVPVVPCHAWEASSGTDLILSMHKTNSSIVSMSIERITSAKRPSFDNQPAIQQGDFLACATQMKVVVRVARALLPVNDHSFASCQSLTIPVKVILVYDRYMTVY